MKTNSIGLNKYLKEISKFDLLTIDEEKSLMNKIRLGDEKAKERLINSNLRFVVFIAKQYKNQGLSFHDLIVEGNIGLIKAIDKYDSDKNYRFITYAVWNIRRSILNAIDNLRVIRIPIYMTTLIKNIKKYRMEFEYQNKRQPSIEEISNFLNIPMHLIDDALLNTNNYISADEPLIYDGDLSFYDSYDNLNAIIPDDNLLDKSIKLDINRALDILSERERTIIELYFGLNDNLEYSLYEIADKLGYSHERIRQLLKEGLNKLKNAKYLENYL